ncbi:winged helix-turn-helix transcriptional regulator [Pediococcus stilesii]|uniref:Winged helix-turn-helix transcriptional regulator n=2 Tax=Pediococcus stilesii TaxID=331679 RepID=A0A5R9BWT3_9LACO|nr:metalloregulator ArsR/SmtB family transcription factor [Pediococcus stilesii]TLQ05119.1 winged helix-turn-helix transcriptional regulator [Pediococcus stilesii]
MMEHSEALDAFKKNIPLLDALSDERRQQIMITLGESELGLTVGELTAKMNLSQPAVSHHLKQLKDLQLVSVQKNGTSNIYKLTIGQALDQVQELVDILRNDEKLFNK